MRTRFRRHVPLGWRAIVLLGLAAAGYATGQVLAPSTLVAAVVAHTVVARLLAREKQETHVENAILVVRTNPAPGREDEYNKWYDGEHVPEILAIPGFVRATRYVVHGTSDAAPPEFRYLAIYEIEGSVDEALRAMASAGLSPSPAMDPKVSITPYVPHPPAA